jgi:hypothetical protein
MNAPGACVRKGNSVMSNFGSVADICALIGEHPDRRFPLRETCEKLTAAGFPTSPAAVHKANMRSEGPPRMIYGGKSIFKLADAIEWAMKRTLKLDEWTQRQRAGKPRGRPPHAKSDKCGAIAA